MARKNYFIIFISAILLVDCASAGLLQSIRDAAMLKDALISGRETRDLSILKAFDMPQSNLVKTELSFLEKFVDKSCPPGDFLCIAQKNFKHTAGNEVSNAVVKSVATVMTDMLNSTISRSLKDMMASANSNDPEKAAEARQAMTMVSGALQTVSSKVIQAFAYFVKVSISGVMWDLFNQMVRAARSSEGVAAAKTADAARSPSPSSVVGNHGGNYYEYKTEDAISSLTTNNLKRAVSSAR